MTYLLSQLSRRSSIRFSIATISPLLLLFNVQSGFANSLHDMLSARSATQLRRRVESQEVEKKLSLVCDYQLRRNRIPRTCFTLRSQRNYRADERMPAEANQDWLTDLCAERASRSLRRDELLLTTNELQIPESCRKAAEQRLGDLLYIDQVERPHELFRRTFRNPLGLDLESVK